MTRRRYGAIVLSLDQRTARGPQRIKCKTAVKSRSWSLGQVMGNNHRSVTADGRSITRERDDAAIAQLAATVTERVGKKERDLI